MELEQIEKIIFEQPNYKKAKLSSVDLAEFFSFEGQVRHFCPLCNDVTILSIKKSFDNVFEELAEYFENHNEMILTKKVLTCSHNSAHILYFYYVLEGNTIIKIGQYPSYEELRKLMK